MIEAIVAVVVVVLGVAVLRVQYEEMDAKDRARRGE